MQPPPPPLSKASPMGNVLGFYGTHNLTNQQYDGKGNYLHMWMVCVWGGGGGGLHGMQAA